MNRAVIATAVGIAVMLAATVLATYLLTDKEDRMGSPPPAQHRDVPAETTTPNKIQVEKAAVRVVAERYTRAITERDEATAAHLTCRKKDPSVLWITAVGRDITVLDVYLGGGPVPDERMARVDIQVAGEEPSGIWFRQVKGSWCVWP